MVARDSTPTPTWLEIADAPPIEGLRFRRPDGSDADYEAMAALLRATSAEDDIPWAPTAMNVREEMEGSSSLDPARDSVIAEIDGIVIALASVERALRAGQPMYDLHGDVAPDWRRRGIGLALLRQNLRRAKERADEAGDPFPLTVRGFAEITEVGGRALLDGEGFEINRWFFLMRRPTLDDIPDAPLPDGIELRPVREADHRAIFDAEFEAFATTGSHTTTTRPSSTACTRRRTSTPGCGSSPGTVTRSPASSRTGSGPRRTSGSGSSAAGSSTSACAARGDVEALVGRSRQNHCGGCARPA